ncbi:MAG: hypothetical protein AAB425_13375, partial [Bdellovibrionota bacterium]
MFRIEGVGFRVIITFILIAFVSVARAAEPLAQVGVSEASLLNWDKAAKDVAALTQKMVLAEDGTEPIKILLVDDVRPILGWADAKSSPRILTVNIGIFGMVQSDEELAFLLGSQLSRKNSDLQKVIDEAARTGSKSKLEQWILQTMVGDESDVRSVLGRMIHAGINPHAAYALQTRIMNQGGQSSTETSRDVVSLGLTHWTRILGKNPVDRFGDAPQSTAIVGPIRERFRSVEFKSERIASSQKLVSDPKEVALQQFQAARAGQVGPDEFATGFNDAFDSNWSGVERRLRGIASEAELMKLRLTLQRKLMAKYAHAAAAASVPDKGAANFTVFQSVMGLFRQPIHLGVDVGSAFRDREKNPDAFAILKYAFKEPERMAERMGAALSERDYDTPWKAVLPAMHPERLRSHGLRLREVDSAVSQLSGLRSQWTRRNLDVILAPSLTPREWSQGMAAYLEEFPEPKDWKRLLDAYLSFCRYQIQENGVAVFDGGSLNPIHYWGGDWGADP